MAELSENQKSLLKELKDYVNSWRKTNGITHSEPLSGDELIKFVTDLQTKIYNDVSMEGRSGQTLILYTGKSESTGNNLYVDVNNYCDSNSNYYYISNTDGGSILWEKDFKEAVQKTIGDKIVTERILSGKELDVSTNATTRINQYAIEGTEILSMDDFISQNLVKKAIENNNPIVYIAGNGWNPNSVGMQTEIPAFIMDAWIGEDVDRALNTKLIVVRDLNEIDNVKYKNMRDILMRDTEFYLDANGKIQGVKFVTEELTEIVVGNTNLDNKIVAYGTQVGILTDSKLISKYDFLDVNNANLNEFRLYDYQTECLGLELGETSVYFDANGSAIGLSCYDESLSVTAELELKLSDIQKHADTTTLSTLCPDYNNLTNVQKLQLAQLELEARIHNYSAIQELVANDTTGYMKNVSISYTTDGKLSGIELTDLSGKAADMGTNSAVFDISWDGTTKARFDSHSQTDVWWKNSVSDIVNDTSISTINGVPAEQLRNSYNNFKALDSDIDVDNKIAKAIDDIPSNNTNENTYIKNMYSNKTDWVDSSDPVGKVNSRKGARNTLSSYFYGKSSNINKKIENKVENSFREGIYIYKYTSKGCVRWKNSIAKMI